MSPSMGVLGKLLRHSDSSVNGRRAPTTKRVKIRNWEAFGMNPPKLRMLTSLPRLEHLECLLPKDFCFAPFPTFAPGPPMTSLRTLIIDFGHEAGDLAILGSLCPRLEHLEVTRAVTVGLHWTARLQHLKFLRFSMASRRPFCVVSHLHGLSTALTKHRDSLTRVYLARDR